MRLRAKEVRRMAETSERIEEALAAYLDHLEMGGPEPDTSHLTDAERSELSELLAALELTSGIPFGLGREGGADEPPRASSIEAAPEQAGALVEELRSALAPEVRIETDTTLAISEIGGIEIIAQFIVGTFGGRVRVWLMSVATAQEVEENAESLGDLNRIFRMASDTAAIALVGGDLSCLLVRPEDTGPQIRVPSGSLVARRYRRSIQPVAESVSAFLDELIPYWDPVPAFDQSTGLSIDIPAVTEKAVASAVQDQRSIGTRARKGNPKKDVLLEFGDKEVGVLRKVAKGLLDGSLEPDQVGERIEKAAKNR
jgi:hypothetical protein